MGVLSWEELALSHMKQSVAAKHKLGKFELKGRKAKAQQKAVENAEAAESGKGKTSGLYFLLVSLIG